MTLRQPPSAPLRLILPIAVIGIGIVLAVGLAIWGFIAQASTETVYLARQEIPQWQPITAEDVQAVQVPAHRPEPLAGITREGVIVGQYATRTIGAGDLIKPDMLAPAPPEEVVFTNGALVGPNMTALPFALASLGDAAPVTADHYVNIGFNDPSGDPRLCQRLGGETVDDTEQAQPAPLPELDPDDLEDLTDEELADLVAEQGGGQPFACRFLSRIDVLYVTDNVAYLHVTPYQALAVRTLDAQGVDLWAEPWGATSNELLAGDRLDLIGVEWERLTSGRRHGERWPLPDPIAVGMERGHANAAQTVSAEWRLGARADISG